MFTLLSYVALIVPISFSMSKYLVKQKRYKQNNILVMFYVLSLLLCLVRALEFFTYLLDEFIWEDRTSGIAFFLLGASFKLMLGLV